MIIWLTAGVVNVRADRAIQWPHPQEIAELRLDFIRLAKGTGQFKLAVITLSPLVVGIGVVWLVASQVLNVSDILDTAGGGSLDDIAGALRHLIAVPDFWLWVYLLFTVSNTMMPDFRNLRGLRAALWILLAIASVAVLMGISSEVFGPLLVGPVADALNLLSSAFAVIIGIDLLAVAVLGAAESVIERVTGDSATFEKGRLVAVTRKEMLEQKRKQAARTASARSRPALEAGPPSIYRFALPIPGAPGRETVSQTAAAVLSPTDSDEMESPAPLTTPQPTRDDRAGPSVIEGRAEARPVSGSPRSPIPAPVPQSHPRPDQPTGTTMPHHVEKEKEKENEADSDDSDDITYVDIEELT
jgi:hypothetical protein